MYINVGLPLSQKLQQNLCTSKCLCMFWRCLMCEIKKCYSETYCLQLLIFNHQGAKCVIKGDILLQYSHVDIKMLI